MIRIPTLDLCGAILLGMAIWPASSSAGSAGDLDIGFAGDGSATTAIGSSQDLAHAVVIQPDGKILVVGTTFNGSNDDFALVRYEGDGTLDASFGSGGIVTTAVGSSMDRALGVALQPDDEIVVVGASNTGSDLAFAAARYDADGNLDASFGTGGTVTTAVGSLSSSASAVAIQPDGKIVVAGPARNGSNEDFGLVRYEADGSLDPTFGGGDGMVTTDVAMDYDTAAALALQADGRIVVAGMARSGSNFDFALVRYDADGGLDATFGTNGIVTIPIGLGDAAAQSVVIQPDGKIVAAGWTASGAALVRCMPNGDLDPSWGTSGIATSTSGSAYGLALQPDGKLVAVGQSAYDVFVIRYAADGLPDATFGFTGTGVVTTAVGSFSASAAATAIQPDGKIVAAGSFSPNGIDREIAVVRYFGSICGDGVIQSREQCDDGNLTAGDGCSPACLLEGCGFAPVTWCRSSSIGNVALKDDPPLDTGARLGWKWLKGPATSAHDFGDPSASADYLLCVYGSSPSVLVSSRIPAGGTCDGKPCWRATSLGFKYKSRAGAPDGINQILLKSGTDGHPQVAVKGKGAALGIPAPPYALPVTVQLERLDGSQCWEATYGAPTANGDGKFKAKGN